MKKIKDILINAFNGFCMALADSVPGVSGGTVAFILGFYDQFINSLNNLMKGSKEERVDALKFLVKLGIGWAIGMAFASLFLTSVFEKHIYEISSLFIGFIIFAIPLIVKEERQNLSKKYLHIAFIILGILVVTAITYFNPVAGTGTNVDIAHLNLGLILYVFVAAMIAISAMILPGISGSTLLLIFGLYIPIISAIKEFLHFNLSYFPILFIFGLGVLTGIALIIRFIKIALEKYRSQTVYCILGLMVGSIYAIVMGPTTLTVPKAAMSLQTFHILFFALGGLLIGGLELVKRKMESSKEMELSTTKTKKKKKRKTR